MTTAADPREDQAQAVARDVALFRLECDRRGHMLHIVAGPLDAALRRWREAERHTCAHVDRDAPMALWAHLAAPGLVMCMECNEHVAAEMDALGPFCAGCGTDLEDDPDYPHANVVVVALSLHTTVVGEACPDCRSYCL